MSVGAAGGPPVGTVGMLFTDIAGSTRLAGRLGGRWGEVLASHHELVSEAILSNGGYIDGTEGDAFFATFADPPAATRAGVDAQRALRAHRWGDDLGELRVRMGVHLGHVERQHTGYVGLEVHRAARVAAAAHGGQLLLTRPMVLAAADIVPVDDLGQHRLKDFPVPMPLYCARIDGRGAASFPPLRTLDARPTNLPATRSEVLGREAEIEQVTESLRSARVVTLCGRGGTGKTSVALTVANAALDAFHGGVWLVSLAAISDPDEVLPTIAAAMRLDTASGQSVGEAIEQRLENGDPALLVLDNMEHLLDAASELSELVARVPTLRLLVTSQAPLRLSEEKAISIGPLGGDAAIALCERAAAQAGRQHAFDREERSELRAVCDSLDGLPLAIELAGARLALLSPRQLRERLEKSLDVVKGGAGRPDRHRSLALMVEWTLGLLSADGRELFTRLGAFAGAVELDEIEQVAGGDQLDVLDAATELLEMLLLTRVETGDGRLRFGMPEALRRLARARLDSAPDGGRWRRAHAVRQFERCQPGIYIHVDTVSEASMADEAEPEARLAVDRVAASDPALASALRIVIGIRHSHTGRLADARAILEPVDMTVIDDPVLASALLFSRGQLAGHAGEHQAALTQIDEAIEILGDADARFRIALLTMRGFWLQATEDLDVAMAQMEAAAREARPLGGPALAGALGMEAMASQMTGRLDHAERRLMECIQVSTACDSTLQWHTDSVAGDIAYSRGRFVEAIGHYVRSLELADLRNDVQQVAFDLSTMAGCAAHLGDDRAAAIMLEILDAYCAARGSDRFALLPFSVGIASALEGKDRLDPTTAAEALREGQAVPAAQRITAARFLGEQVASRAKSSAAVEAAGPNRVT